MQIIVPDSSISAAPAHDQGESRHTMNTCQIPTEGTKRAAVAVLAHLDTNRNWKWWSADDNELVLPSGLT